MLSILNSQREKHEHCTLSRQKTEGCSPLQVESFTFQREHKHEHYEHEHDLVYEYYDYEHYQAHEYYQVREMILYREHKAINEGGEKEKREWDPHQCVEHAESLQHEKCKI